MTISTIPRSVIIEQYYKPNSGTAEQIAYALNYYYRVHSVFRGPDFRPVSKREVERIWEQELEQNIVLRGLGDRPAHGFSESDKTALVESLMGAAAA